MGIQFWIYQVYGACVDKGLPSNLKEVINYPGETLTFKKLVKAEK